MNLLSIQSHVAYGHVGNSAAVFPLQRIGVEVWPIHTVQFSNHNGYGDTGGRAFDGALIDDVMKGIAARGVLGECDGVLSGYVGSVDVGNAIVAAVESVKGQNPAARYCCDPVIGDVGRGVYVHKDVAVFLKDTALTVADIVTPNQFELDYLTGAETKTLAQAFAAIDALHARGPATVVVTSLRSEDTPTDCLDLLVSDPRGRFRVRTPLLPGRFNSAGDAITALFVAHYLRNGSAGDALAKAASAVYGVLCKTIEAGSREILLVAAQDELVKPSQIFAAEELGG